MSGDLGINVKESFKEEFKGKQEIGFVSSYRNPRLALLCWMNDGKNWTSENKGDKIRGKVKAVMVLMEAFI